MRPPCPSEGAQQAETDLRDRTAGLHGHHRSHRRRQAGRRGPDETSSFDAHFYGQRLQERFLRRAQRTRGEHVPVSSASRATVSRPSSRRHSDAAVPARSATTHTSHPMARVGSVVPSRRVGNAVIAPACWMSSAFPAATCPNGSISTTAARDRSLRWRGPRRRQARLRQRWPLCSSRLSVHR